MSIELALEDQMCVQQGRSARLAVSLARKEAALCEKLETLGMKKANVVVWQVHGITWGRWQNGSLKLAGDAAKKCYADYRYVRIAAADVEGGMEDGNAR